MITLDNNLAVGSADGGLSFYRAGQLPSPWREDPFAAGEFAGRDLRASVREESMVVASNNRRGRHLMGLGTAAPLAAHIGELLAGGKVWSAADEADPLESVEYTRGAFELMDKRTRSILGLAHVARWDWMYTRQSPEPVAGEDRIVELDPTREAGAITALQQMVLPGTYTKVGRAHTRWYGAWGSDGELVAMAAATSQSSGNHLGSIGTHPRVRGHGLGRAVTAYAARQGIAEGGQSSLGLYATNTPARRLYESLGFRLDKQMESRHATQ